MPDSARIRRMFSSIASRYDLLNRVLSLGTDRAWRRRSCRAIGLGPGALAADLCCGTGDLALAMAETGATVFASDFSHEMLVRAGLKGVPRRAEADCLRLPFADSVFDVVMVGFGVRNLADLRSGLDEIRRVLRPGGRVGILEFARPRGLVFRGLYHLYLRWAVPWVGAAIARRRSAYRYLADSIRQFPDQASMKSLLVDAGYADVRHLDFVRGVAALYIGTRAGTRAGTRPDTRPVAGSVRGPRTRPSMGPVSQTSSVP